jgi:uncharacterized protein (DUF433 family)
MATTSPIDIGTLITRTPGVRGGRPCITGRGVSVMRITGWYKQGWIPEQIARRLELTLAQVHAALAYYHANQEEIEADLATEADEYERLQKSRERTEGVEAELGK